MVDLIRAQVAQVVEQQTEKPLPKQALVGVAQNARLFSESSYSIICLAVRSMMLVEKRP